MLPFEKLIVPPVVRKKEGRIFSDEGKNFIELFIKLLSQHE